MTPATTPHPSLARRLLWVAFGALIVSLRVVSPSVAVGAKTFQTSGAARGFPVSRYDDAKGDAAYWDFLPAIDAGAYWYWTRATAAEDVDGDGAPDDIAIVSLQRQGRGFGTIARVYLLVGERDGDALVNRSVTVLFDERGRPEYEDCPLIYPLADWEAETTHARLDLVDLTGDGIPEVCFYPWGTGIVTPVYLSVHTHRDGEFVPILRRRCQSRMGGPQYGDQDGDGAGDIILSNTIVVEGKDTASDPDWVTVFEWDGEEFVDDTKSYHAADVELMDGYIRRYEFNTKRDRAANRTRYYHEYEFYMGMIHLFRGELREGAYLLGRVAGQAGREVFQNAAREVLADMPDPAGRASTGAGRASAGAGRAAPRTYRAWRPHAIPRSHGRLGILGIPARNRRQRVLVLDARHSASRCRRGWYARRCRGRVAAAARE
jgi:hypothetical protein